MLFTTNNIAQPKPSPALTSPNPKLGARVCTNMQLVSLSLSALSLSALSTTQVSHLLKQLHYLCQFNSDHYETLNLSSWAIN